jgi:hypothetical protein
MAAVTGAMADATIYTAILIKLSQKAQPQLLENKPQARQPCPLTKWAQAKLASKVKKTWAAA